MSSADPVSTRRRARLAHLLLVGIGLLVLAYPFTFGASAEVTCRGVVMGPGDRCPKADGSGEQTYEQRVAAARDARPVVAVGGLLLAGFGVVLLRGERRPARP